MRTLAPHRYTFTAINPAPSSNAPEAAIVRVVVVAPTPAAAEAAISDQLPHLGSVAMLMVEREGDGCGDARCAACYPSSRNARLL